jgi:lipoprotein-anchoring transpeptidase ErfK/SrfK
MGMNKLGIKSPHGLECALIMGDFCLFRQRLASNHSVLSRGGGMGLRTAGAITVLLLGLAGTTGPAVAQLFPLPAPQILPPPFRPPAPVEVEAEDGNPPYDPPPGYRRAPPPGAYDQGYDRPPYGRGGGYPQEVETNQLPPPAGYGNQQYGNQQPVPGYEPIDPRSRYGARPNYDDRRVPGYEPIEPRDPRDRYGARPYDDRTVPGYEPIEPRERYGRPNYGDQPVPLSPPGYEGDPRSTQTARPNYGDQPPPPPGYEVDPRSTQTARPSYGDQPPQNQEFDPRTQSNRPRGLFPNPLDIFRPPASVGPSGPGEPAARPSGPPPGAGQQETVVAALPPEERPETGPKKELPTHLRRTLVDYRTKEPAGTLVIDTANTYLYLVLGNGKAMRYGIGVGREGFTWSGAERVSRMAEWPDWHPPAEMIERQPYLPRFMAGGEGNPLGARALYLGKTLYRIHGTNQPSTIGTFVSSGCIRLTNEDIIDLYQRVSVGSRVVVLPGRPPASASAAPQAPQGDRAAPPPGPPGPYNPLAPPRSR